MGIILNSHSAGPGQHGIVYGLLAVQDWSGKPPLPSKAGIMLTPNLLSIKRALVRRSHQGPLLTEETICTERRILQGIKARLKHFLRALQFCPGFFVNNINLITDLVFN